MPIEDANFYSRSFSKKERICSKKVLLQLILNKKTLFCYPFKCYYQIEENTSANTLHEIAVAVPKKKIPLAVDRNRIKRLVRESYRLNKYILYSEDNKNKKIYILIVYVSNEMLTYNYINNKIITILQRLSNSNRESS